MLRLLPFAGLPRSAPPSTAVRARAPSRSAWFTAVLIGLVLALGASSAPARASGAATPHPRGPGVAGGTVTGGDATRGAVVRPGTVRLTTPAPRGTDASRSSVVVLRADGRRIPAAAVRGLGGARGLEADVPRLGPGIYTAVWSVAADGRAPVRSSTAFTVDPKGGSPALVRQETPKDELPPTGRALPKWLDFVAIMVLIGVLALRRLSTGHALSRAGTAEQGRVAPSVDRALLLTAGVAAVLLVPTTLAQLVYASADDGAGFWSSARPGAIWDYVSGTPDGTLWEFRLLFTLVAVVAVVPAAAGALRRGWTHRPARVGRLTTVALVAGVGELLSRVVPTETPDQWVREIFTDALDFVHLLAASVWVGGLVGLAVLGLAVRVPAEERGAFWSLTLKRFSLVATVCVGAMIASGLWTAWIHVGPPRLLFHTLYGETLLVKLALVLVLLGLGGLNQLWLLPRIQAIRATGGAEGASLLRVALRHFRRVIVLEAVVGLLVLLVVPFLSGSARRQDFQRSEADLTRTAPLGSGSASLRPSGLQPGTADYDLRVPGAGGHVAVAFSAPRLGIPATQVLATSLGGDRYRVSGLLTPVAGDWRTVVTTASGASATFALPVTATAAEPGRPAAPAVRGSTWAWGIVEIVALLLALVGAGRASRWITDRRIAGPAAMVPGSAD